MEFVDKIEKHGIEAFNFETRAVYLYVLLCTYIYINIIKYIHDILYRIYDR